MRSIPYEKALSRIKAQDLQIKYLKEAIECKDKHLSMKDRQNLELIDENIKLRQMLNKATKLNFIPNKINQLSIIQEVN